MLRVQHSSLLTASRGNSCYQCYNASLTYIVVSLSRTTKRDVTLTLQQSQPTTALQPSKQICRLHITQTKETYSKHYNELVNIYHLSELPPSSTFSVECRPQVATQFAHPIGDVVWTGVVCNAGMLPQQCDICPNKRRSKHGKPSQALEHKIELLMRRFGPHLSEFDSCRD